ncbi:MAG: hypothetical protein IJ757_08595 [Clostridiales bacterium]|nr:hypothetical protein [Clostridiales bacterium]
MIEKFPRDALTSRCDMLLRIIDYCRKRLSELPEGRIRISRRKNTNYYYIASKDDKSDKLISEDDRSLAERLAQRVYLERVLKTALTEERIIDSLIERYPSTCVEDLYETLTSERQELISPIFKTDQQYRDNWLAQEFRHKGFKDGMPFYMTVKGERVRSKSEQIIADRLTAKNITYIYEKPLTVGNMIFHPDFSILRMSDRKELYLEHLGMLGDLSYATDAVDRINRYHRSGIVLGDRLFLTGETTNLPFDVRTLDVLIEEKFR